MREFMRKLQNGFIRFMTGRYGMDALSKTLYGAGFIFLLLSLIARLRILNTLALLMLLWAIFRMYSRNIPKRYAENEKFLAMTKKPRAYLRLLRMRWQYRKTHRVFRCECGQIVRIPRGKGKVEVRCPKCGRTQIRHS